MQTIHQLAHDVVAQIAAGEVIERPAYAVKELLDNAIDAGATEIDIEIEDSGFKKIRVTDNGIGMSKEDLRESVRPHSTSKISSINDLHTVKSFGFRGEALWSIAAISDLSVTTRQKENDIGFQLELHTGEIESLNQVGAPHGTTVTIQNLFKNIPVRHKFMRSRQTEFRHIFEVISNYALAFPEIGFKCVHNSKNIINFSPIQTLIQRITSLYGPTLQENTVSLHHEHEYITMSGFITNPQAALTSHIKQLLYVNNRRVFDKKITAHIKEAYGTLLEPKVQPAYIIFLSIPAERIDVNIHPRKEQVAFAEPKLIGSAVYEGVIKALGQKNIIYHDMRWKRGSNVNTQSYGTLREGNTHSYAAHVLKETVDAWTVHDQTQVLSSSDSIQVHNTFIITQTQNGILLIDQHAAHERILYEQFLEAYQQEAGKKEQYTLPRPLLYSPGIRGYQLMAEHLAELEKIGFEAESYGHNQYVIRTIPLVYKDRNIVQFITEALEDLSEEKSPKAVDAQSHKMLSFLACRSAIKAGDKITKEHARNLVEKLKNAKIPYTCPHGRPVQVELTLKEIYKLFHRI
jgi:DNA mismatch repair protein MutL